MRINDFVTRSLEESKRIREAYAQPLKAVREADPNYSDIGLTNLAVMLDNTDRELARSEKRIREATQAAAIGDFRRFAFPVITAVYPSLITQEIVSYQAMKQKTSQVFYLDVVAGTNKGDYAKGDVIYSPNEEDKQKRGLYSTEIIDIENGADITASTAVNVSTEFKPVRPGTFGLEIYAEGSSTPAVTVTDKGDGTLEGTGVASGTINYATGAVAITLSAQTTGSVEYHYEYNNEVVGAAGTLAPELDLTVKEITLKARSQKLRTNYAFDAAYDLQVSQGVDIDKVLLEAASNQLKFELDGMVLADLYKGASNTSSWSRTKSQYISEMEHNLSFIKTVNEAKNKILSASKRCVGNILVVGAEGATILQTIGEPRFKSSGNTAVGPHFAGTLDGTTKVFIDPYFADNEYLVAYKGDLWIDAGYVVGTYLPLFSTNVIMLDDFIGRRGYGMSNARRMLKPYYYVAGKIVD